MANGDDYGWIPCIGCGRQHLAGSRERIQCLESSLKAARVQAARMTRIDNLVKEYYARPTTRGGMFEALKDPRKAKHSGTNE